MIGVIPQEERSSELNLLINEFHMIYCEDDDNSDVENILDVAVLVLFQDDQRLSQLLILRSRHRI